MAITLVPPGLLPERVRVLLNGLFSLTQSPAASVTPTDIGELAIQATSNTQLTFKLKGSDGTVRSGSITLS